MSGLDLLLEGDRMLLQHDERVSRGWGGRWYGVAPATVSDIVDPDGQGRIQVILPWCPDSGGSRYEAWGRQMIEIRSAFGESGDYDATSLLTDNLNLPLGAVALHGRFLVLLHKACLDDISVEAALFLLTRVTLLADVLEGRAGKDRF